MKKGADGPTTVRKLPFPISLPSGRIGRGHLLPDLLSAEAPAGFVRIPGGGRFKHGMIGLVGTAIGPTDMIERWVKEFGALPDQHTALAQLQAYVTEVAQFKIGNVVEVAYSAQKLPILKKLSDTPPVQFKPRLPR